MARFFSLWLLLCLVSAPTQQAGFCIPGKILLYLNWITGSQYFTVSGWNAFLPWIASHWRGVISVRLGKFFHIFCCGCCYNIFQQQTPCSFLERFPKCYFWHFYFLQRGNVIGVVGLASTFSQLTAPSFPIEGGTWGHTAGRGELYLKSQE